MNGIFSHKMPNDMTSFTRVIKVVFHYVGKQVVRRRSVSFLPYESSHLAIRKLIFYRCDFIFFSFFFYSIQQIMLDMTVDRKNWIYKHPSWQCCVIIAMLKKSVWHFPCNSFIYGLEWFSCKLGSLRTDFSWRTKKKTKSEKCCV